MPVPTSPLRPWGVTFRPLPPPAPFSRSVCPSQGRGWSSPTGARASDLRFVMRSNVDQVDAMLGVFGCARATDGVVGLDSLAGWSAMNLSVSGFCRKTEVRNSRSSFVDPLLLSAPPREWCPVRWINCSVRCGPCLCLLFYPDSSGSDDNAEFTDPNWSCQRVFNSVFCPTGTFTTECCEVRPRRHCELRLPHYWTLSGETRTAFSPHFPFLRI